MKEENVIVKLPKKQSAKEPYEFQLESGRSVRLTSGETEDLLEVRDREGEMTLSVRLTDKGPVFVLEGARLEMKSTESIRMKSRRIELEAEESTRIKSEGKMDINAEKEMDVHSDGDVRITGKIIHLN